MEGQSLPLWLLIGPPVLGQEDSHRSHNKGILCDQLPESFSIYCVPGLSHAAQFFQLLRQQPQSKLSFLFILYAT